MDFLSMTQEELKRVREIYYQRYKAYRTSDYHFLLTRGKPCREQLDLSLDIMDVLNSDSDFIDGSGEDCRNYGIQDGLTDMRKIFGELLEVPYDSVIIGNNSSLSIMFDVISCAMTHGFAGMKPWGRQDSIKFLCPSPGYDRHFAITEYFDIEMIPVPMLETGPDMDIVERYVNNDKAVKGIWCVPKYSNPTGITYSDETVRRFANLSPAAKDFRIFWDNAYCVHDLTDETVPLLNLYEECKKAGTLSLPFMFASSSKITFAGSGVSALATWESNAADIRKHFATRTIGPDKLNQLRHIRFLKNRENVLKLMKKHREIIAPKFQTAISRLNAELSGTGIATWNNPKGGYFISVDVLPGCARRVVELCRKSGVTLNPAGSTYPYYEDPQDSNIRIAPTYPSIEEIDKSMEIFSVCTCLAAIEKLLD